MSVFVLIHGAWHGGWCWRKLVPLLEEKGHTVLAPDMPVAASSLQAYTDRVCEILDAQAEPVVLVGHSMGGAVISQAAEHRPEKVRGLVYLCAYLLRDGESLKDAARRDTASQAREFVVVSPDRSVMTLRDDALDKVFYAGCSAEDIAWGKSHMAPQGTGSWATPVHITEERFGRAPRVYIECLHDRAISPALQRQMYRDLPCRQVFALAAGHAPFVSAPEELAAILLRVLALGS